MWDIVSEFCEIVDMTVCLARRAARSKLALTFAVLATLIQPALAETRQPVAQAAQSSTVNLRSEIETWQRLFENGSFSDTAAFLVKHPNWPKSNSSDRGGKDLREIAESRLTGSESDREILGYFSAYTPRSPQALDAYVGALKRDGKDTQAKAEIRKFWLAGNMSERDQAAYLNQYRSQISSHEVYERASRLVWENKESAAQAISGEVSGHERAILRARLALRGLGGNIEGLLAAVPSNQRNDPGLVHDRVRYRNTHDDEAGAIDLLLTHPVPADGKIADWWKQRENLALVSLRNGQIDTAYRLASQHGFPAATTEPYMGAEWLSGWIALRFKNDPQTASRHFKRMYDVAVSVVSRARGAYWLGRAAQALGENDKAKGWYQVAAKNGTSFYGQAAAVDLYGQVNIAAPADLHASAAESAAFEQKDLVRIIRTARQMGNAEIVRIFFKAQVEDVKTQAEASLTVALATEMRRPDLAAWAAKNCGRKGFVVGQQGYPQMLRLPSSPEAALINAIIRQESGVYQYAESPAGALGYMQIMPATGRELARKMGETGDTDRLLSDGAYNIRLGSYYLTSLIEKFNGSYVLAAAAYNGGPGRVARWVDEIGDPRSPSPPIARYIKGRKPGEPEHWMAMDVIETYPFGETRFYIHQVLAGLQIYHAVMGKDHTTRLTLRSNLTGCRAC